MVRQVGSHRRYVVAFTDDSGAQATAATTVPQQAAEIPAGTLRAIERDLEAALGKGMAAMSADTYRVVVTREDGHWLADVPSLEGCPYLRP